MYDVANYTIGWVSAINPELVAARLHLDTRHDKTEYVAAPNDHNTYVFGSIGMHNVVVACLPSGVYGTNSAAGVARDMVRTFTNVRVGLMVGIGGGAPLMEESDIKKQDIRLGDVVVSVPGDTQGGVWQYDYGKAIHGGEFKVTGHLNSPPVSLLTAVASLRAEMEVMDVDIHEQVVEALESSRKLQKTYSRPDADLLYASTNANIVERAPRENGDTVKIHYGLIASANQLMKDAVIRSKLARKGVLCFEMEAAGLMNQLPFLVVRGISDYSDMHKNDDWQGYAAMTAAAYAKRLLLELAPNKVESELALGDLKEMKQDLQHVSTQVQQIAATALRQDIERWLSAADPSTNHNTALALRHERTGSWMLQHESFTKWRQGKFPLLWLHGISGCGKTVLASTIIEHLAGTEAVLYFYFDMNDTKKQGLNNLLRSLIKQLCHARESSRIHVEQLYAGRLGQPTTMQLVDCFKRMVNNESITVVIDALDECALPGADRQEVLAWSKEIALSVRCLVTSRTEYDIRQGLAWIPSDAALLADGTMHNEDLKAYVRHRIFNGTDGFTRWRSRPDVQQKLEESLVAKADGLFRWVVCQMDILVNCTKLKTLRQALEVLPKGLDQTYAQILSRISDAHRADAIRLLQFLTYSHRPLRLDEAVDALAVDLEAERYFNKGDCEPDPEEIAAYCGSLTRLVTRKEHNWGRVELITEIQLAHSSVREYLSANHVDEGREGHFKESRARASIVQVSIAYLCQASDDSLEHIGSLRPFEMYAGRYWLHHASSAEAEGVAVLHWIDRLFSRETAFGRWKDYYAHQGSALYHASRGGLTEMTRLLLHRGVDVDAERGREGNALQVASSKGHVEVVKLLLASSPDVNARGGRFGTAMTAASFGGHIEVVKLLLAGSADVNINEGMFGNALQVASSEGHIEVVELLLASSADVNARGGHFDNALTAASFGGHIEVVKLLLAGSADVNVNEGMFGNALIAASLRGHLQVVELLLAGGADINGRGGPDSSPATALQAASERGHAQVTKLLLASGADINARGGDFGSRNALHGASHGGHLEVVEMLLAGGADVNARGAWDHRTALDAASEEGHIEVIRVLLAAGADISANDGWGGIDTALKLASDRGRLEAVRLLLAADADVDTQQSRLDGALQAVAASYGPNIELAKLLLTKGAGVNTQGDSFGNALRAAMERGNHEMVQLLEAHEAQLWRYDTWPECSLTGCLQAMCMK